ncbi:DinB family protein [Planotetraspora thailandica]|nr:DinB family protein [Planotetraspora thailandica]
MAGIGDSLEKAFDFVWGRFIGRLEGLSDDEYFWEPVPDCWSVRQDAGGRWRIDGDGGGATGKPVPEPAPFTTIAWRIGHIGLTFIGFGDRLFADGKITIDDVDFPGSARDASAFLDGAYRDWREGIARIDEQRWWSPIGPAFGPYAKDSTVDLAVHVFDEIVHHGGEVGVLRDLYLRRDVL